MRPGTGETSKKGTKQKTNQEKESHQKTIFLSNLEKSFSPNCVDTFFQSMAKIEKAF